MLYHQNHKLSIWTNSADGTSAKQFRHPFTISFDSKARFFYVHMHPCSIPVYSWAQGDRGQLVCHRAKTRCLLHIPVYSLPTISSSLCLSLAQRQAAKKNSNAHWLLVPATTSFSRLIADWLIIADFLNSKVHNQTSRHTRSWLYPSCAGGRGVVVGPIVSQSLSDVFCDNEYGPNFLFRNNGDGTFTDVAPQAG